MSIAGLSEEAAFDLAMARFKTAWEANTTAIVGYIPQILWPDVTTKEVERGKIIVKLVFAVAKKVRRNIGQPAWYHYTGSMFAIILSPIESVASEKPKLLAKVVKDAFQGMSEGTDFYYREVTSRPFPPEGAWNQYRVEVKFEGDERL